MDNTVIKVFKLNEYEWWAGGSWEEVKKCYMDTTGLSEVEAFDDECHELTPDEMNSLKFYGEDNSERTFQEELDKEIAEGQEFPCFFAGTEQ